MLLKKRKTRLFLMLIALISILSLCGCATVLKGTSQEISFISSPSGAKVYIDGHYKGETPLALNLRKNRAKQFRIELEGYRTIQRTLYKDIDVIVILNYFSWDLGTTDYFTGAMFEYSQYEYFIELEKRP